MWKLKILKKSRGENQVLIFQITLTMDLMSQAGWFTQQNRIKFDEKWRSLKPMIKLPKRLQWIRSRNLPLKIDQINLRLLSIMHGQVNLHQVLHGLVKVDLHKAFHRHGTMEIGHQEVRLHNEVLTEKKCQATIDTREVLVMIGIEVEIDAITVIVIVIIAIVTEDLGIAVENVAADDLVIAQETEIDGNEVATDRVTGIETVNVDGDSLVLEFMR